jgi:hypothetical protein
VGWCGLYWSGLGYKQLGSYYEYSNDLSSSIKCLANYRVAIQLMASRVMLQFHRINLVRARELSTLGTPAVGRHIRITPRPRNVSGAQNGSGLGVDVALPGLHVDRYREIPRYTEGNSFGDIGEAAGVLRHQA